MPVQLPILNRAVTSLTPMLPPDLPGATTPQAARDGAFLPVPAAPNAVARAIRQEQLTVGALPDRWKAFVAEVERFLAAIRALEEKGLNREAAVTLIRARDGATYRELNRGHRDSSSGGCKLTVKNATTWFGKLGKRPDGTPDLSNRQCLIPQYACGCQGRKGEGSRWQLFISLYHGSGELGIKKSYDDACRTYRLAGNRSGWPTQSHAEYWIQKYDNRYAQIQAQKGSTYFRNHVAGYLMRDWSNVRVGEIWIGDHRKTDNFAKIWDEARQEFLPKRIWITAWRDARSGHFVGWLLYPGDENPNAEAIMQCLILAIRDNGGVPPAALYIDNGLDFRADGFTEPVMLNSRECSVVLSLGIEMIVAIKFNARAKLIENSFKTLIPYFDKVMPGYCGSDRGSKFDDAWKWAKANLASLPSLEQSRGLFEIAVAQHEARVTHSMVQDRISTELLWENRTAFRPALTDDELHLRALRPLGETEMREIRRGPDGPSVQHDSGWYSSEELRAYGAQHWGERVRILVDVFAAPVEFAGKVVRSHIYCAAPDGTMIGRCDLPPVQQAWARTDEERAAVGEGMRRIRRFEKDTKAVRRKSTGRRTEAAPLQVMADWLDQQGALPAPGPQPQLPSADSADSAKPTPTPSRPDVLAATTAAMFGAPATAPHDDTPAADNAAAVAIDTPAAVPTQAGTGADAVTNQDVLANLEL